MFVAQELRKKSIAEYLLYMWQVEDIIRAYGCSLPVIRKQYIDRFDYTDEQLAKTCSLDLTMVTPKWRGHGLQRLFNKIRIGEAIDLGATEGYTSISPENPYSYNNFLILGWEIVDRRDLYGGKDRYLIHKNFFEK